MLDGGYGGVYDDDHIMTVTVVLVVMKCDHGRVDLVTVK